MIQSPKKIGVAENARSCRCVNKIYVTIYYKMCTMLFNFALTQHKSRTIGPHILASLRLIGEVLLNRECGCQRVNNVLIIADTFVQ